MGGDVHVGEASRSQDGAGCGRIGQRERIGGRSRGRLFAGEDLIDDPLWRRRMTARNALRLLQDEGLITAEHGRGVYVRARPPVRRLASDRFAQRHRKEGKAAFSIGRSAPTRCAAWVAGGSGPPEQGSDGLPRCRGGQRCPGAVLTVRMCAHLEDPFQ
jgi:hypothetical protein